MTEHFKNYLVLNSAMLAIERIADHASGQEAFRAAEDIRLLMDTIWWQLTDKERTELNKR